MTTLLRIFFHDTQAAKEQAMTHDAATRIIDIAAEHAHEGPMASSAASCLDDARTLLSKGDAHAAAYRAMSSISYSVGIFHAAYTEASSLISPHS